MIWVCDNCGAEFEDPEVMEDDPSPAGVGLPLGKNKYFVCPGCGSEDIEEYDYDEETEYE